VEGGTDRSPRSSSRKAPDFSEPAAGAIRAIEGAIEGAKVISLHREEDVAAPHVEVPTIVAINIAIRSTATWENAI
jgi:hypothetical protein